MMKKLGSLLFFLTLLAYSIEDDYLKIKGQINQKTEQDIYIHSKLIEGSFGINDSSVEDFLKMDAFLTIEDNKCKIHFYLHQAILFFTFFTG